MTFLAGVGGIVLVVALALGLATIGEAAVSDARAQIAADAAALAAVAESGPGGSGQPIPYARRYAESNGAHLISCICESGAAAVQVTVAIGDVSATARAEIDPSLFRPLVGTDESAY